MSNGKIFGKQGFFAKLGKRNLLIIGAVLLVGLAVYLNYVWFYDPMSSIGYGDNNMQDQYGDGQNSPTGGTVATMTLPASAVVFFTPFALSMFFFVVSIVL